MSRTLQLLAAIAIGSSCAGCHREHSRLDFDFIGRLGGVAHGNGIPTPKGLVSQYYVFDKPIEDVKAAIRAEYGPPVIDDRNMTSIFTVGGGPSPIRIVIMPRVLETNRPYFPLAGVALVGPPGVLAPVAKRYDWEPGFESEGLSYASMACNPYPEAPVPGAKSLARTVAWVNFGYTDATFTIVDCQFGLFDSREPMPMVFVVHPLETKRVTLTYPPEARLGDEMGSSSDWMNWYFKTQDGSHEEMPDPGPLLLMTSRAEGTPKNYEISASIPHVVSDRILEIKNVKLEEGSNVVWRRPGPWRSPLGKGVRFSIPSGRELKGQLTATAEYRVLPNTRWRLGWDNRTADSLTVGSKADLTLFDPKR